MKKQFFIGRAIQLFRSDLQRRYTSLVYWRDENARGWAGMLANYFENHSILIGLTVALVIWLGGLSLIWFSGTVNIREFYLLAGMTFIACVPFVYWSIAILVVSALFVAFLSKLIFWPLFCVGTCFSFSWYSIKLMGQFFLVIPLSAMFLLSRARQLWHGIFFTCPSRTCSYRGLPAYVCPHCGQANDDLWPNLYGVFWHYCTGCDNKLPTLNWLGRDKLKRHCGRQDCRMPLTGRHSGLVPERLVSIIGGPDSGKTCYLTMVVHHLMHPNGQANRIPLRGIIDTPEHEQAFQDEWQKFSSGNAADKTIRVPKAFLTYTHVNEQPCQLYLYDAPGEEFLSISAMSQQQYFHLVEGFILLVDPLSVCSVGGSRTVDRSPLIDVVTATINTAVTGVQTNSDDKFKKRVAVVISKADMKIVQGHIGDIRKERPSSASCRQALLDWGEHNTVRALEDRFVAVKYFTCSSLGRDVSMNTKSPFEGYGLLEPLYWVVNS